MDDSRIYKAHGAIAYGRLISSIKPICYWLIAPILFLLLVKPLSAAEQYWEYTVRPGDNIWNLTQQHCTSVRYWKRIQTLNKIDLDREIPPGTRLRFPLSILKHQPATALVYKLQGSAQLLRAGSSDTIALQTGAKLRSGDRIKTGPDSNLAIQFADGSVLLVLSDSEVTMDSLSAWGKTGMVDTRIRLQGGRVDTQVQPSRGPGSRYQIITPAAVAAVRGTAFRVAAERENPVMRSEVTEGALGVGSGGKSTRVPAGFGLVAESGKPPSPPRKLLPPVNLNKLTEKQQLIPIELVWPAISGAQAYRVQVAPDRDFNLLLIDTTTKDPGVMFKDLPDGHYVLRIRGIDEVGLEGLDAVHPFEVDARPFPPTETAPPDGSVLQSATPTFSWKTTQHSNGFRLQLARDPEFTKPLADENMETATHTLDTALSPGSYYWRVAGYDKQGQQGPFSEAQTFIYRRPLTAPQLNNTHIDKSQLSLSWQAVNGAEHYQVQLATTPSFQKPETDIQVDATEIKLERPPSQVYYLRVRAINAAGERGPFSDAQTIHVPSLYPWWPLLLAIPLLFVL